MRLSHKRIQLATSVGRVLASGAVSKKKSGLTVIDGGDNPPAENFVRRPPQKIGDFIVPYGYEVWSDGLYIVEAPTPDDPADPSVNDVPSGARRTNLSRQAHQPIWIRRIGRVLDTGEQILELAFKDALSGQIVGVWVDRGQISTKLAISNLAKQGVPVTEAKAVAVMAYLDAALNLNGQVLPVQTLLRRTGAHEVNNEIGWLLGSLWIGAPTLTIQPDPRTASELNLAIAQNGSEEEWFRAFLSVGDIGPIARWVLHSTFAPPLLRFLQERTFIIHLWAKSGTGKSALGKLAMSAWGDPDRLMQTFNRTKLSFTETFQYVNDVPVFFDELQVSQRDDIMTVLYSLVLEQHRGRANQTGGLLARGAGWRTIVNTTGEEPIGSIKGKADLGGIANRVLQIGSALLAPEHALQIHKWCERKHYGWGGPAFIRKLYEVVTTPGGQASLIALHQQMKDAILEASKDSPMIHVRAGQLATVAVAQFMASRWFREATYDEAFTQSVADAAAVAKVLSHHENRMTLTEQVIQLLEDHYLAHRGLWFDLRDPVQAKVIGDGAYRQLFAVRTTDEIWIVQKEATALFEKAGFPPRRVCSDLYNDGVLHKLPSAANSYGCVRKHKNFVAKVYVLDAAKFTM